MAEAVIVVLSVVAIIVLAIGCYAQLKLIRTGMNQQTSTDMKDKSDDQMAQLMQSMQQLQYTVSQLQHQRLVEHHNPNVKGSLGNVLLAHLLEDLYGAHTKGTLWDTEFTLSSGRPDAVVKLHDKIIPIDSKNVVDDYIKYLDGQISLKQLTAIILQKCKDIAKYTTDAACVPYVLLFLPSEHMYYNVFIKNAGDTCINHLYKECSKLKVIICSPSTLYMELVKLMDYIKMSTRYSDHESVINTLQELESILTKNVEQLEAWVIRFRNISSENESMLKRTKNALQSIQKI